MSNILEDRATCFEEICDGLLTNSCWWKEKAPLFQKVKYLNAVIKESFCAKKATKNTFDGFL